MVNVLHMVPIVVALITMRRIALVAAARACALPSCHVADLNVLMQVSSIVCIFESKSASKCGLATSVRLLVRPKLLTRAVLPASEAMRCRSPTDQQGASLHVCSSVGAESPPSRLHILLSQCLISSVDLLGPLSPPISPRAVFASVAPST